MTSLTDEASVCAAGCNSGLTGDRMRGHRDRRTAYTYCSGALRKATTRRSIRMGLARRKSYVQVFCACTYRPLVLSTQRAVRLKEGAGECLTRLNHERVSRSTEQQRMAETNEV